MTNPLDRCLVLVSEALRDIDNEPVRLSAIIRKCIRVARLRNDYANLWWLEQEMCSKVHEHARLRIQHQVEPHFSKGEFTYLKGLYFQLFSEERKVSYCGDGEKPGGMIYASSIEELEQSIEGYDQDVQSHATPTGMHPFDTFFVEEKNSRIRDQSSCAAQDLRAILSRVRNRCHQYLSAAEKELIYGQLNSNLFEKNREYVDSRLRVIAPTALEMFVSIFRRLAENDAEARSQALVSCRRLLKALADSLYPAKEGLMLGVDGQARSLKEDKYVSRLLQFVGERCKSKSSGEVLSASLEDLGNRLESLYAASCKGVHDQVSEYEVNQCAIQTYLLAGDLLRISDELV